jgi:ABC-type Zn uptake system ZnuABC Zn-binding protein ZnuA
MSTGPRARALVCVPLLVGALVIGGCSAGTSMAGAAEVTVVATTTVVGDFVRELAADRISDGTVDVTVLLVANVDAHDFEPSAADMLAVSRADVIVANGAGLETFLGKLIRSAEPRVSVTEAADGVALHEGGHDHGHGHGGDDDEDHEGADPHIWHDPRNAVAMVRNVADALAAADPEGAPSYRAAEDRYVSELEQLDSEIGSQLAPFTGRSIVTNHDALGYYADRYGLDVIGAVIPSFDSSAEVSARDLDELVARIRRSGASAVFAEASMPPGPAEAIAREAGVRAVTGPEALYTDGLGPRGSDADTYLRMMRHNPQAIVAGLR